LLAVAARRVPEADLREGGLDELPFADGAFDAVIAINALQFAFAPAAALREIHRVLRPGGRLALGQFAAPERCESTALHLAMEGLIPDDLKEDHAPYALSEPGALERALTAAGLTVVLDREQPGRWRYPDLDRALRGVLCSAGGTRAITVAGEDRARAVLTEALAPFHTEDGYVMHNHFRLLVAQRSP
jgi:SAM-dependent methyltransferase